jgi:hypothetical protein
VIEKVRWPRKGAEPALAMNDLFRKNKQKAFTSPPGGGLLLYCFRNKSERAEGSPFLDFLVHFLSRKKNLRKNLRLTNNRIVMVYERFFCLGKNFFSSR